MFLSSEHIFVNKLRETDNTIEHNGCARLIFQKKAKSSTFFDLIVVHVRFLRILLQIVVVIGVNLTWQSQ